MALMSRIDLDLAISRSTIYSISLIASLVKAERNDSSSAVYTSVGVKNDQRRIVEKKKLVIF